MTIADAIAKAAVRLAAHRIENARLDAEVLLRQILGKDRAWLLAHYPDPLDERSLREYDRLLDRRSVREPLQYILGSQEFWGLSFIVTPDVLIPRPETELIVETALRFLAGASTPVIADLCTGSGCIAVALATELPSARIFATDQSTAALAVAHRNASGNKGGERIRFFEGDLFEPLKGLDSRGKFDVITANPPYIPAGELASLQPEVRDFEPEEALIAGPEGTEISRRILAEAPEYLKPGGTLIMEMGIGQARMLAAMANATGKYESVELLKDLAGIERVIRATKK
ncbi:MAG: peptide chain release factor N(5)-glutamine methyltransferase [Nitrospiraceae bacterium]|nr:peptide chain release factor N(5)-glutamine methyltransferase [Nitrospiraceae bacterium]